MTRINTNIQSLVATRVLNAQNRMLGGALDRLSTGLRINTGKDDPAGLIASELLRSEQTAIRAAITNVGRANNIVATAEGGLQEVNNLLITLEDLLGRSANEAGISEDERAANQLEIDAILESINRIANSTEFQGRKLLSGELDYQTSSVNANNFAAVSVKSARLPNDGFRNVSVEVLQSAQLATLNFNAAAITSGSVTIQVAGNLGSDVLTFGSGTSIADVAQAIQQVTGATGVSATVTGVNELQFTSTEFGSKQFVSIRVLDNQGSNFDSALQAGDAGDRDYGRDANVIINGSKATTDGLRASVRTSTLSLDLDLSKAFNNNGSTDEFQIIGGGADFSIAPSISINGQASLGIQSVSTSYLGNANVGFLQSLASGQSNALSSGNFQTGQRILREAQQQISELRGRLGSFSKDTLETTAAALQITLENTTAAESSIRDTDFAAETSNLTRAQILVQSATNVLRLANSQPQSVLQLLG